MKMFLPPSQADKLLPVVVLQALGRCTVCGIRFSAHVLVCMKHIENLTPHRYFRVFACLFATLGCVAIYIRESVWYNFGVHRREYMICIGCGALACA